MEFNIGITQFKLLRNINLYVMFCQFLLLSLIFKL